MKRWYALLGTFLLAAVSLSAQDADMKAADTQAVTPAAEQAAPAARKTPGYQLHPNAVGMSGISSFSGGLTYQRWLSNGFGFGVTAGGYVNQRWPDDANYNVQLSVQKILAWSEILKGSSESGVYLTAVAAHLGRHEASVEKKKGERKFVFKNGVGLGLGVEFLVFKRASFTAEILMVGMYPLEVTTAGGLGFKFRF